MKIKHIRHIWVFALCGILLVSGVLSACGNGRGDMLLSFTGSKFTMENREGDTLTFDGAAIDGTMEYRPAAEGAEVVSTLMGNPCVTLAMPYTRTLTVLTDSEFVELSALYGEAISENNQQLGVTGHGVKEVTLDEKHGIRVSGEEMDLTLTMQIPNGLGLIRCTGTGQQITMAPAKNGFSLTGMDQLSIQITSSDFGEMQEFFGGDGSEMSVDLTRYAEGIVSVTQSDIQTELHFTPTVHNG